MGQIQADRSVKLDYVNTLVWAFTWHHQTCAFDGPDLNLIASGHPQPTPTWAKSCEHVVLINAKTGSYMFMYDGPAST